MTDWKQLANEISRWLNGFGRDGLQFYPCTVPGWPGNGFKSDGILTDGRTLLALEVEAQHAGTARKKGAHEK